VLLDEVLISKLGAIDGLATGSVALCEVTSLAHEAGDHSVELATLEPKTLLSCAQCPEIL